MNPQIRKRLIMGYVTGRIINELREKQKITQKELAEKRYLSDLEKKDDLGAAQ